MKRILMVAAVLCVAGTVAAQPATPKPKPGAGGPRSDQANEEAIRKLYVDFTTAWNAHDANKLASFYTIDGDTMEPDGATAKGRDEVENIEAGQMRRMIPGQGGGDGKAMPR